MKIFIVGGTGFLGYYSTLEALKRGHEVGVCSLPDIELGNWFPEEVSVSYQNVFEIEENELIELLKGYDAIVYSVGPDDRVTPKAPAYEFFYDRLVTGCTKVMVAARKAGIKKAVVLGSYFSYFNKIDPKKKLAERHPYIRARMAQEKSVIEAGGTEMSVSVLELPYIFGAMPKRDPIWKDLLYKMLLESKVIFFPKGGTAMISAKGVSEAVMGAIEKGEHGKCYPVGDVNMSFKDMLTLMLKYSGMNKSVVNIPKFLAVMAGKKMKKDHEAEGKESGLDPIWLMKDIQTDFMYFNNFDSKKELGYNGGDIESAIEETINACK